MTDDQVAEYLGIREENMATWNRIPKIIKKHIRKLVADKIYIEEDLNAMIHKTSKSHLCLMDFGASGKHVPIPIDSVIRFWINPETDAFVDIKTKGKNTIEIFSSKKMFISPRTSNISDITVANGLGFDGTQKEKKRKGGRPRAASNC